MPPGYNFDFINADALVHLLSVVDGQLAAPSGMRTACSPWTPTAGTCRCRYSAKSKLVRAGAVVAGPKPLSTPSLSDDEAEFRRLADALWGSGTASGGAGPARAPSRRKAWATS